MAFVTAIGDIFPLVTAIADTNVSNGCDNGAVTINLKIKISNGTYSHKNPNFKDSLLFYTTLRK